MHQNDERFYINEKGEMPQHLKNENIIKNLGDKISFLDEFHEGLAVFMIKNNDSFQWGFMNKKGQNNFNKLFEYASVFKDGVAIIKENGKFGAIDKKGNYILKPNYEGVGGVLNGKAWIKRNEYWNFINIKSLKNITNQPFKIFGETNKNGIQWVEEYNEDSKEVKRAFMNMDGEIITDWFSNATNFNDTLARFEKDSFWGVINDKGQIILPNKYDYITDFSEDLAGFTNTEAGSFGKWGYINMKNEIMISQKFNHALSFKNGMAQVWNQDNLKGFINKQGKLVIPYQYQYVNDFSEGLAAVRDEKENLWGFINISGEWIIPPRYEKVLPFEDEPYSGGFSGNIAKVKLNGREFFIDKKGTCVIGCLE